MPVKKKKQTAKLVVGESQRNTHVHSVPTQRTIDVFVSRLHPATTEEDLTECVNDIKDDIDVKEMACTRLKSKYETLYASYDVAIRVDSAAFKHAIDVFMSAGVWPQGVFVKRFFRKRDGSTS